MNSVTVAENQQVDYDATCADGPIWRPAVALVCLFTIATGLVYPFAVGVLAAGIFPEQAGGSLVRQGERVVGSALIGQSTTDPGLFWGRPSAIDYNAGTSSGSNWAMTNPALLDAVSSRTTTLRTLSKVDEKAPVPVDLVTASGSGLDPHISPAAALFQVDRVARARNLDPGKVRDLVLKRVEERTFGVLGERRVNVFLLNLDVMALGGG